MSIERSKYPEDFDFNSFSEDITSITAKFLIGESVIKTVVVQLFVGIQDIMDRGVTLVTTFTIQVHFSRNGERYIMERSYRSMIEAVEAFNYWVIYNWDWVDTYPLSVFKELGFSQINE